MNVKKNKKNEKPHISFSNIDIKPCLLIPNDLFAASPQKDRLGKNCAATLAKPLAILFRHSYFSGKIPNDWKLGNIVPVHKKGNKNDVSNYRPISLTSIVMKQFEKLIRTKIMNHCGHLITNHQHGFLPEKSLLHN